jgi:two-component system repressor protein LuxO
VRRTDDEEKPPMAIETRSESKAGESLLLVEADEAAAHALAEAITHAMGTQMRVQVTRGGKPASDLLRAGGIDIILADIDSLSDLSSLPDEAIGRLARLAEGALMIALSGAGSVSAAVNAMRAGAHDCLAKPVNAADLASRLEELATRHGKSRSKTHASDVAAAPDFAGFVGGSSAMQYIYEQISRLAPSSAPVFITGEAGTGKTVCASALHSQSPRSTRRMMTVDCAATPRELLEGELFGVARGTFSGSHSDRPGAAELADGGTLFLDEIGEMDLSLQGKLLRFLQTGMLSRIGEVGMRRADVRVVCATSRNPMQLVAERRFREDLFYRLHVLPVHLPPLRQRTGDVLALARHFLDRHSAESGKKFGAFSAEAVAILAAAEWPGNVRQLENLMRRIVALGEGGDIASALIRAADMDTHQAPAALPPRERRPDILPMWQQEQRIIEDAIASFSGNVSLAAAALEISPSTIYRKRQSWADMAAAS